MGEMRLAEGKPMKIDKYVKLVIIIILIATIIRISLALIATPAGDGCWHFSVSRFIAENFKIPLFEGLGREIFSRPPLFHIAGALLYIFFNIFRHGAIGIKMVSVIFGSLSLWLCFLIAKKLYNTRIAFYATVFLAFLPAHMYLSSLAFIGISSSFFVLLSIYLLLNEKFILASITAGLSLLSKYTAFFAFFVLLYILFIQRKNISSFIKKTIVFFGVAFLIALPWYVRNFIRLGNPVWPFLSRFIGGIPGEYKCSVLASFWHLLNIRFIFTKTYFSFFGVPNGDFKTVWPFLSKLADKIPGDPKLLLVVWAIATIIFILPLIIGFIKLKYKSRKSRVLLTWIFGLVLLNALMLVLCYAILTRYLLPSLPALAIIFAIGFNKIRKSGFGKIFSVLIILVIIGFASIEFTKASLASREWKKYSADFDWIRNNTNESDIIFANGQCFSMNFNRLTWDTNIEDKNKIYPRFRENLAYEKNISYIWINQEFTVDPESSLNGSIVKIFEEQENKYKMVYQNNKTRTKIYEVIL